MNQQYQRCPHCSGPLYVSAQVNIYGPRLRLDGTWDFRESGAETGNVDRETIYCGDCETEWPSVTALEETKEATEAKA